MLDHFADIDALDLDGVEPMTHPTPIANVMRDDVEVAGLDRDEVLAAAPQPSRVGSSSRRSSGWRTDR